MSPSAVSWRWKRKSGPTDVNASIQPSLQNPLWSSFEKSEEVPVDGVKSVSHAILDLELLIGRASRFLRVNYGDHVHLWRRGPGWRIHGSVEDTKLSTNKQHSLSLPLRLESPQFRNPETDGWAEDVQPNTRLFCTNAIFSSYNDIPMSSTFREIFSLEGMK